MGITTYQASSLVFVGLMIMAYSTKRTMALMPLRFASESRHHRNSELGPALAPPLYLPKYPDYPITNVMAPMVAASDFAFRCLCRQFGVDLTYTQMLHAKNLLKDNTFSENHLDMYELNQGLLRDMTLQQSSFLSGRSRQQVPPELTPFTKGPLIVQLAGNDVGMVVDAAQYLLEQTDGNLDGIDLNCGCPQGIARKGRYGAFLMEEDSNLVCDILTALRENLPQEVAVSAKIRLPERDETLFDRIPALVNTGVEFLTVHGRTLKENKSLVRAVHTDRMQLAVETARRHRPGFPVIANGGIEYKPDALQIRRETKSSAVMSSEGLLEFPNIFLQDSRILSPRELFRQQVMVSREYLKYCQYFPPLHGVLGRDGSASIVKGHLFKFLYRYLQEYPRVRDSLTRMTTLDHGLQVIADLEETYACVSNHDLGGMKSSKPESSWYRRHRNGMLLMKSRGSKSSDLLEVGSNPMTVRQRKALIRSRLQKPRSLQ